MNSPIRDLPERTSFAFRRSTRWPARIYLGMLLILLTAYMFFGRPFAHLGREPVYPGEVVLVAAIIALAISGSWRRLGFLQWLLLAWMGWSAARTFPYLAQYRADALRDGALWGYALFAFATWSVCTESSVGEYRRLYGRVIPFFLVWVPLGTALSLTVGSRFHIPGTAVPVFQVKGGDTAVHLAGVASFAIVGLSALASRRTWVRLAFATLWAIDAIAMSVLSRGGALAMAMATAISAFLRPTRLLLGYATVGIGLVAIFLAVNPNISLGSRTLSPRQLTDNLSSIFVTPSASSTLQDNKAWRLKWWGTIWHYTAHGRYFWTGKGYGINLADSDGFVANGSHDLRAPHNATMNVLARSGIPGLALWIAFQLAFAVSVAGVGVRRAPPENHQAALRRGAAVWVLAYWAAMMVNGSFDVYLEGPQGGIWFWSLIGLGMVIVREDLFMRRRQRIYAQTSAAV